MPSGGNFTCNCGAEDCVKTVCVTRCDDTTGDGSADTTYSELWCIRADGTATLVLTYQTDPSTPYVPVSPVECTYGSVECETVTLCDAEGAFLRRYRFLSDGTAMFEDVALDGATPHVVTGDVGACTGGGGTPCEEPTTPAATLGLCLPDGTPLAVVVTRDCGGQVTQDGWINLTTGAYTAGPPPAGAAACGDSRAFELAGVLCDVDPGTGDVHGLVLLEYAYAADGSLASVTVLDAATGQPYTLQGELRRCPTGTVPEGQPEQDIVVLCDTADDGTTTAFVRDYRRDAAGTVTGHTDYTLTGQPYTPTGTVGVCGPQTEPCHNTNTLLLCDTAADATPVTPDITDATVTGTDLILAAYRDLTPPYSALWSGGSLAFPADSDGSAGDGVQVYRAATGRITATPENCAGASGTLTASVRVTQNGPGAGSGFTGAFRIYRGTTMLANAGVTNGAPPGHVQTLAVTAPVTAEDLAGGDLYVVLLLETWQGTPKAWTADQFTISGELAGCTVQFMRTLVTDCATGQVVSVVDTALDGQPYEVTGEVGQCQTAGGGSVPPPEPCPAQNVLEVCRCDDTDGDGVADAEYVELLAVDCNGVFTSLGTYLPDLSAPYSPVAPVDCATGEAGAPPPSGVQARRVELAPGQTWDAASVPTLQSVTAVAHGGPGTITTEDGISTLHATEAATWSVARDTDAVLRGPLTITAGSTGTGTVTITWTQGVTL